MSSLPDLETVTTPALLLDRQILVDNITRMAARAVGRSLGSHSSTIRCSFASGRNKLVSTPLERMRKSPGKRSFAASATSVVVHHSALRSTTTTWILPRVHGAHEVGRAVVDHRAQQDVRLRVRGGRAQDLR